MTEEMRKDLIDNYGSQVEYDEATWVHPWVPYWRLYGCKDRDKAIKELSEKYKKYTFHNGVSVMNNTIYPVIIINN